MPWATHVLQWDIQIPNGVPLPTRNVVRSPKPQVEHLGLRAAFGALSAPEGPKPQLLLGTSARLSPQKKLEELLGALRLALPRLPPCTLWVAGGPERGFEEYTKDLQNQGEGLPIEWLGDVDVSVMLRQIDLFLMISEPAGCPNASLEAMAEGLPVIATDVGGASEQVIDGISGLLVPRGDVRAFAEALIILANDASLRLALGQGARQHVEEKFALPRMIADYRRILLNRRGNP